PSPTVVPAAVPTVVPAVAPSLTAVPTPTGGPRRTAGVTEPVGDPLARGYVYLTFDGGPSAAWTPQVVAQLRRYGARATFFVVGRELARHPDLADQLEAAGQAVGDNTYSGGTLVGATREEFRGEVGPVARMLDLL